MTRIRVPGASLGASGEGKINSFSEFNPAEFEGFGVTDVHQLDILGIAVGTGRMVHNLADDEVELGIRGLVWSVDGVNNDSTFVLQSEDFTKVREVSRVRRGGQEFLSSGWGYGPVDEVLAAGGDIKVSVSFDDGAGPEREPHSSFKRPVLRCRFRWFSLLWIRMNSSSWFPLAGLASTSARVRLGLLVWLEGMSEL